jgi:hypothetical protein
VREKYEVIRNRVREILRDLKENVRRMKTLTDQTMDVKKKIEINELIIKQADTDLALIYENLVQMKHDQKIHQHMHPEDPELRTVRDRLVAYEEENEMLFNRLEHWQYPYYNFICEEEQEEAIKFLDSVEWQRALHQAIKPI